MGIGDDIMAAGQAQMLAMRSGKRVRIVDRFGSTRKCSLWDGNPHIAQAEEPDTIPMTNGPGARPYIDGWDPMPEGSVRQRFTHWRAQDHRATLYLSPAEKSRGTLCALAGPYVLIEPHVKLSGNPNKQWPVTRYAEVMRRADGVRWVQVGLPGTRVLKGAHFEATSTFREAAGVLSRALCYLGTEGALHHAAAALQVPAVVIFGGAPSVAATGYPEHFNLGGDDPCGKWGPCAHCRAKIDSISVDHVLEGLRTCLTR